MAEQAQTPAVVMTDLFLADSYRAVDPFDLDHLEPITPGADPGSVEKPYLRYRITASGVSPRLIPLASEHLVRADSHEHYEHSLMNEEPGVRVAMVDKRMRKMDVIKREVIAPEFIGDDKPEALLVCWGSTRGSALEAAAMLRDAGRKAAVLHFSQVWPLVPEQFLVNLQAAREVVGVESNAQGQFARLLRRESGFEIKKKILQYDGRVITPEYILSKLEGEE
jgi:2-oxoglutarate ferredoxin oxidoreductase subunit alpha